MELSGGMTPPSEHGSHSFPMFTMFLSVGPGRTAHLSFPTLDIILILEASPYLNLLLSPTRPTSYPTSICLYVAIMIWTWS